MPFGIGHPPSTHQLQSTCVGEGSRVPSLQTEFNYLDLFKCYGIFSDFVVPVVPTLSLSSPSSPCHPRVIPIAPRRSPCGLHGCGLRCLRGLHPMLSPWYPRRPHHPHVIPVSSLSSPHRLEDPHIIPNPPDTHSTHVGTTWRQHEDNVETTWGQHGDHWDVETTWGQHGDHGDVETMWG